MLQITALRFRVVKYLLVCIVFSLIATGVYYYKHPITVNFNVLPYGSFRVKYKLFNKHILIDKIIINNCDIYIQPILIPFTLTRIPRIYIGLDNGFIIIRNLKPLALKNNPIEIEIKDFNLSTVNNFFNGKESFFRRNVPILHNIKNWTVTAKAEINIFDNKRVDLIVKGIKITNTLFGSINMQFTYLQDKLNLILELPKYNHKLKCSGKISFIKPLKWDFNVESCNIAKVKNLKINGSVLNGDISYNLNWRHGYTNEKLQLKTVSENTYINNPKIKNLNLGKVRINLLYNQNQVDGTVELQRLKHVINCNGTIQNNTFDLNIIPKAPISIKNFKITENLSTRGELKYFLRVCNHGNKNKIEGNISLSKSNLQSKSDTLLNNITAEIKIKDELMLLEKCEATIVDFLKCKINAGGKLDLNNLEADLRVRIPNGAVHNVPMLKSAIDADMAVKGNIKSALSVTGNVTLINPSVDATSIISSSLTASDVVSKFVSPKNGKNKKKWNEYVLPVNADIRVNIADTGTINGVGLKSTWRGGGKFIAKAGNPITWDAKINAIDGQYEIVKRKIKLSSGEILFNSQLPHYYKITIVGQKKIDTKDIVGIKFIQYNDNTVMDFFSTAMRSKQDILSLFLFGKENSELSTSEAYSLGLLVQNLAIGNDSIFSKLNKMLKIDTFEIKHNTNSEKEYNTVVVGKKVGKWQLSFEQGKNFSETQLSVNRKIKRQTKVGVNLSRSNGIEGGISWNRRY